MKALIILVIIIMFLLVIKINSKRSRIISVASIYSFLILFLVLVAVIFDNGKYGYWGYIWLMISVVLINMGQLATINTRNTLNVSGILIMRKKTLLSIIIVFSTLLSIYGLYNYFSNGGIRNSTAYAYSYYTDGTQMSLESSIINQLVTFMSSALTFLGGFCFVLSKSLKEKAISVYPFFYEILVLLYTTIKLGLVISIIMFFIGMLISVLYNKKKMSIKILLHYLKKYWYVIPILIVMFVSSFMLRFGRFSFDLLAESFEKLISYTFSSCQVFNRWFSTTIHESYSMGAESFLGIPHALGLIERQHGIYDEALEVSLGSSNIYTAFRPLISDFGIFGGLFFILLFGFVSGISFNVFYIRRTRFSFCILAMCYLYVLYSPIISPYVYLSLSVLFILVVVLNVLIIRIFDKKRIKKCKRMYYMRRYL